MLYVVRGILRNMVLLVAVVVACAAGGACHQLEKESSFSFIDTLVSQRGSVPGDTVDVIQSICS